MLEFKPIECADQQAMNRFLLRKGNLSAHRNFTTLYMWGKLFDQQWCEQDGWLFIRAGESFYLPLGEEGKTDLTWPVEQIKVWRPHSRASSFTSPCGSMPIMSMGWRSCPNWQAKSFTANATISINLSSSILIGGLKRSRQKISTRFIP